MWLLAAAVAAGISGNVLTIIDVLRKRRQREEQRQETDDMTVENGQASERDGGSEASTSGRQESRFYLTPLTMAGVGLLVVAFGAAVAARRGARKHK